MIRVEINVYENCPSHGGPATAVEALVYVGSMEFNRSHYSKYRPNTAKAAGQKYVIEPFVEWAQDLAEELGKARNSIKVHFNPAAKKLFL